MLCVIYKGNKEQYWYKLKFIVKIAKGENTEELRTEELRYRKMWKCIADEFLNVWVETEIELQYIHIS